jgi:hypothetical protein
VGVVFYSGSFEHFFFNFIIPTFHLIMSVVWFGVTAKAGEAFDQKIRLNSSCNDMKWIMNSQNGKNNLSSREYMIKANAVPFKHLVIETAVALVKRVGVCAIIATVQDKTFDIVFLVILVPNSRSMRGDIFVVPQRECFSEAMVDYNLANFIGAGENFSDSFPDFTIFLLTQVQFFSLNSDNPRKVWDSLLDVSAAVDKHHVRNPLESLSGQQLQQKESNEQLVSATKVSDFILM